MFVGWGHSGRRLFSASADGRLVVRDMLTGDQLAAVELGQAVVNACLNPADESQLLVSLAQGPARFVDLHTGRQTLLPAFVLGECPYSAASRGRCCWLAGLLPLALLSSPPPAPALLHVLLQRHEGKVQRAFCETRLTWCSWRCSAAASSSCLRPPRAQWRCTGGPTSPCSTWCW